MRRGTLPILGVLVAFAISPAAAEPGADRLVEACQVAVSTHAGQVALDFPVASRQGGEVHIGFSFVNAEREHSGQARCVFRISRSEVAPPSLLQFELMGRITPARFLMSHHAVWAFFTGQTAQAAAEEVVPSPAPPLEDSSRRRTRASLAGHVHG